MLFINEHEVRLDEEEGLVPWTSYDRVVWLAMDFIRRCPVEARSGLRWYLVYSCFWTDPVRPVDWPDNPAGKAAMAVETLVRYYAYSGEGWFIDGVRSMLDRLTAYRTPDSFAWPGVPYASAEPGFGGQFGARGDGHFVTEPDKVAQAGQAYLSFFKLTGEEQYLSQARHVADVLADKVRAGDDHHSPWPFRVDVCAGTVVEAYTSHVIAAIRLFDEMMQLDPDSMGRYGSARQVAWEWLLCYPMQTNKWKGYFEDIRLDPENGNREQYSPMETARYLLLHPEKDADWEGHVRALVAWVKETLGAALFFKAVPIHEQKYCYHVMGSHTARFASVCALLAEATGDADLAECARRSFSWASYMADDQGLVRVGIDRPDYYNQCWFSDGYFDYVPHFLDGMGALPEMAPSTTDHLLRSSSIVQRVTYEPLRIRYRTFDDSAGEVLRLTFEPVAVEVARGPLRRVSGRPSGDGWSFDRSTGVLLVRHSDAGVEVRGR
jgi:hypothetical protein